MPALGAHSWSARGVNPAYRCTACHTAGSAAGAGIHLGPGTADKPDLEYTHRHTPVRPYTDKTHGYYLRAGVVFIQSDNSRQTDRAPRLIPLVPSHYKWILLTNDGNQLHIKPGPHLDTSVA